MTPFSITEHVVRSPRHTSFYLASGPADGPLVVFMHGWPELALSWRHQLPAFGALGFRAVAPDMRGYGRSSVHAGHGDYPLKEIVADMIELIDHLGREKAVWVGHDWGSPAMWSVVSHHPERALGAASLCVPYRSIECGIDHIVGLVDRRVYPQAEFPAGQWDYMRFYEENFAAAVNAFEADVYRTVKALFRKGSPAGKGKPTGTAFIRAKGGWFGGAGVAPDLPHDTDVVSEEDLRAYAAALSRNGFFGPDSWYMNDAANIAYTKTAKNGGRIDIPALFLAAEYDYTCESIDSDLARPMRDFCSDLTERRVASGHWMAQERPREVNAALLEWIATKIPAAWPR